MHSLCKNGKKIMCQESTLPIKNKLPFSSFADSTGLNSWYWVYSLQR